jgi:hypothetical protein
MCEFDVRGWMMGMVLDHWSRCPHHSSMRQRVNTGSRSVHAFTLSPDSSSSAHLPFSLPSTAPRHFAGRRTRSFRRRTRSFRRWTRSFRYARGVPVSAILCSRDALTEVHLVESCVYRGIGNLTKAKVRPSHGTNFAHT